MKILKENQDQLSSRVVNIENTSGKKGTIMTNTNSKGYYQNNWKILSPNKQHANNQTSLLQQFKIPLIVNHYTVLENLQEENQVLFSSNTKFKPSARKAKDLLKTSKVLIIGDSHARGCAANLLNCHGESFEVTGDMMPGARLQNITQTAKQN